MTTIQQHFAMNAYYWFKKDILTVQLCWKLWGFFTILSLCCALVQSAWTYTMTQKEHPFPVNCGSKFPALFFLMNKENIFSVPYFSNLRCFILTSFFFPVSQHTFYTTFTVSYPILFNIPFLKAVSLTLNIFWGQYANMRKRAGEGYFWLHFNF